MGKAAEEQYRDILQSGVENRYMIRLPVVGPFDIRFDENQGRKSRLAKNLLISPLKGKTISNTKAELAHIPFVSEKDDKVANTYSDDQIDEITKKSPDEEMIKDEMRKTNRSTLTVVSEKNENTEKRNSKLQDKAVNPAQVQKADLYSDLKGWSESEAPLEDFAEVALLDFAGQYEFYATHQAFLNKHAIYLLVIDVSKNMKGLMTCEVVDENFLDLSEIPFEDIGEYINFWMDAIHCYGDEEQEIDNTKEALPSIIVVGTCCDKLQIDKETRKWEIQKQFDEILGDHPKRKHIKDFIMLSNTTSSETDFDVLRHRIVQLASKVETWGQQLPTRWIKYEQVLDQHRENQDKVMTYQDMKSLGKSVGLEIKDMNEVNLFLRYQHEIGNLIYFDNIPDLVILQPQWLVDVLKCLVSARKFQIQRNIVYNSDWKELETTGRLTEDLITQAFRGEEEGTGFFKYRSHILQIMEKFDIIVKPNMAEEESVSALEENDVINKSQIPTISLEPSKHRCRPALYRGMGVFNLDSSGRTKLAVCVSKHVILLQIWKWGKHSQVSFKGIWEHAQACITGIKGRYKMNVSYTVKMKCCNGSYDNSNGMMEMTKLESDEEYFCDEHAVLHSSKDLLDSWFKFM
ncbi:neuralized pats1, partial [Mytilus galloprovincialis]